MKWNDLNIPKADWFMKTLLQIHTPTIPWNPSYTCVNGWIVPNQLHSKTDILRSKMTKCQTNLVPKKIFSTFFLPKIVRNDFLKILKKKFFFEKSSLFWAQKWPKMAKITWKYFFRDSTEILQPTVYDTTIFEELMKNRPAGPCIARGG